MKRVWKSKEVINGWEGKPIRIQIADDPFDEESIVGVSDLTILGAMLVIANNYPCETLEDSSKKKAVKQALRDSIKTGLIELDGEEFKWLKTASEKICPKAWQDNANEVHDIITEGFRKENERFESKKEEGELQVVHSSAKRMTEFIVSIFMAVLAGDLLYLYYKKGWYDPNKKIEYAEVACLYALALGGIANCIKVAMELLR